MIVINKQENSKVFLTIVKDIKSIIQSDGLKAGDKIPSERTLTERLQVGRSSVREALRALELLGLIETRRGEGTFLTNFKNHRLISLLGMFILEDSSVKKDLQEAKEFLEKDIIRDICSSPNKLKIQVLMDEGHSSVDFDKLMELANNHLLYRIWIILKDYSMADMKPNRHINFQILDALVTGNEKAALSFYDQMLQS